MLDTNDKMANIIAILFICCWPIVFFVAEFLIFYNPEARAGWLRMLPCAIISPFLFAISVMFFGGGVISLVSIPTHFIKSITEEDSDILLADTCIIAGGGLIGGGGIVVYWIYGIVILNLPAFGYNPDNVYAITGINTMFFLPLFSIIGTMVGGIVFGLLYLISIIIRQFKKIR